MAESRAFKLRNGITAEKVGKGVEWFLRNRKNLVVESAPTAEGFFVQAKEESGWKKFAGMDLATQVQIIQTESIVTVEVGTGKWADKIGAGAVGMVLFAPLAVTAAVGAYGQKKLPSEIFSFVEQFITSGGENIFGTQGISQASMIACPKCGEQMGEQSKFCPSCGEKMVKECPNCKAPLAAGVKFCSTCGTPITQ